MLFSDARHYKTEYLDQKNAQLITMPSFVYKGREIKESIACCLLLNLIPLVFGQKRKDLAPLSYP